MKTKEDFKARGIEQSIYPTASSKQVLYYATKVINLLFDDSINTSRAVLEPVLELTAAFHRETGEHIEPWELFSCDKEKVLSVIFDSVNLPDTLISEMRAAFDWSYLHFSDTYLYVSFPKGSLPSQKEGYYFEIPYKQLEKILHSWAIPKTEA